MNMTGALVMVSMLGLLSMGVVTPIVMVRRAIRTRDPFDRPFLLASAVGTILWVLILLTLCARTLVPDSAMPAWIANPLQGYATATTWLYRNTNLLIAFMFVSIVLTMSGALAAPQRRPRASRRQPE